jgi:hypothetical protein
MEGDCIDVTVQLQALVKDSKLIVPETNSKVPAHIFVFVCVHDSCLPFC